MLLLSRAKSSPAQGFIILEEDQQLSSPQFRKAKSSLNPISKMRRKIKHDCQYHRVKFLYRDRISSGFSYSSNKEQQYQKSISQNKYTINLTQNQPLKSLTKIPTIAKTHGALISEDAFQHYKRINSINGRYQQALIQFQKEDSKKMYKIKLPNSLKIKTRKNIYQDDRNKNFNKTFHVFGYPEPEQKFIKKPKNRLKENCKSQNFRNDQRKPKIVFEKTKWNLRDFLDPITSDSPQNKEAVQSLKSKLAYLGEISRINRSCQIVQSQLKTKTYLDLFSKFNQNVSSKLQRKKKKLEKIQKFCGEESLIN